MNRFLSLFWKAIFTTTFFLVMSQNINCNSHKSKVEVPIAINNKVYRKILITEDFNPIEAQLITEAAKQWSDYTGGMVEIQISTKFDKDYVSVLQGREYFLLFLDCPISSPLLKPVDEFVKKKDKDAVALGFYDRYNIIPTVYMVTERIRNRDKYRQVAVHEIGHALGLDHDESTDSVMYRSLDKASSQITKRDLISFCKIYDCKVN